MKAGRIAKLYRWIEYAAYGRALERARFWYLDRLAGARRILVLGEGDGRALARLVDAAPHAEIDVVELSAEMIALARLRVGDCTRLRFHQADALSLRYAEHDYDGVVTLFFLDCFSAADARTLIGRLAGWMAGDAIWLMTDFAIPESGWRRWHARVWITVMYAFFRLTTGLRARALPPIEDLMRESGLRRIEVREWQAGLIRSEVWRRG